MASPAQQRRAAHAAGTHADILQAARTLFARQGYFATTIEQVAHEAEVSPATVYAVAGGKQGLMRDLAQLWADSPIRAASLARLETLEDPHQILALVAQSSRDVREQYGDVMKILLETAPHESAVAERLATSTGRYRGTLAKVAERLHQLGALKISTTRATDVLWFCFGYTGFFTLTQDNGWSFDDAQTWLLHTCTEALIQETFDGSTR